MQRRIILFVACMLLAATVLLWGDGRFGTQLQAATQNDSGTSADNLKERAARVHERMDRRITQAEREAAADRLKEAREKISRGESVEPPSTPLARLANPDDMLTALLAPTDLLAPLGKSNTAESDTTVGLLAMEMPMPGPGGTPDYFGCANWAFSPPLRKFVDTLPGLGADNANNRGQYIPVAVPDAGTYPGSDYYEIGLVEYTEQLHSDLPPTTLRGYVQLSTSVVPGGRFALTNPDGSSIKDANNNQVYAVDKPHYLGPTIVAQKDRPVRVKFTNLLPTGEGGDLFIPVDTTVMGAGMGPLMMDVPEGMPMNYTQNRATVHLHGGRSPWISDGTPHQWITPAGENTPYPKGVSVKNVPDMPDPGDGSMTFYYTNQQSARMMFYHDHSYGITRLNVYSGEAAGYLIEDEVEKDLVERGIIPADQIPLIIQDKTFVDSDTIGDTDPTWNWGTGEKDDQGVRAVNTGDLWLPHVYVPAQNPYDIAGVNPFGRWHYGPWFWPPTTNVKHGPVPNPYYDPINAPWQPPEIPGTPHPSMGMEAFFDTAVVNGTAFPSLTVEPKSYRFRILNAANDRFWNLQLYTADPDVTSSDGRANTEVKMIPASACAEMPANWPTDGRAGGVPDPTTAGPEMIQIGTEGGFLPKPAVLPNQPITWNADPTTFNVGNVDGGTLILGPAERADIIVDFSEYAGKTLILYNDAPAAYPALDPRYDYYAGSPDMTDTGGHWGPQAGYGPNTRTIMQIKVEAVNPAPAYDLAALEAAFASTDDTQGVFARGQDPIIVGQTAYNSAYNTTFPNNWPNWGVSRIQDNSLTFKTTLDTTVTLPMEPKAIQDEMGEAFDKEYGRMSGFLGLELPNTVAGLQNFMLYPYGAPPTEIAQASVEGTQIGELGDGTQIWKITHNGVDTHPIHFHLFDVQLINRVAWDGMISLPDDNELGWKDTVRVNPLEDTIVALRPVVPTIPFQIPNSVRLLDPTMPEGAVLWDTGEIFDPAGEPVFPVINRMINFGWEYMWHCHILSHEEMDMMRPISVVVRPEKPTDLALTTKGSSAILTWTDNSINETGFIVQRAADPEFTTGLATFAVAQDITAYTDNTIKKNQTYHYRVLAINVVGDTTVYEGLDAEAVGFPTRTANSEFSNTVAVGTPAASGPVAPTNLVATLQAGPQVSLTWTDNATNETSFVIERSTNGGAFAQIAAPGPRNSTGSMSYTDTAVTSGNTYAYRVKAVNSGGSSGYSNEAGASIGSLPAAPSNLMAMAAGGPSGNNNRTVTLSWMDNADSETGFIIQRATNTTFTANLSTASVGANITSLQQTKLPRNTTYYYRIRAVNFSGTSAWVNATPFPITTP